MQLAQPWLDGFFLVILVAWIASVIRCCGLSLDLDRFLAARKSCADSVQGSAIMLAPVEGGVYWLLCYYKPLD